MKKLKKKKILFIIIGIIAIFPIGITFSKYVYDSIKYYLVIANSFYFNSDKLEEGGITYNINNWGGVENFTIQFELNNHKNNLLTSDTDITYQLNVSSLDDVICSIDTVDGIIYKAEMTDSYEFVVTPERAFDTDENVTIHVEATSSSPYVKTLSADFVITVGKQGISYQIIDEPGQPYFNFILTNALDQYKVITAFDSYSVGDIISTDTYKNLSSSDKEKCASAIITLGFDPNIIVVDTTTNEVNQSTKTYQRVGDVDYVSSVTFKVDAVSSTLIRFYKKNVALDYTYPNQSDSLVLNFNAVT